MSTEGPKLRELAARLGVELHDPALWLQALTHRSYTEEHPEAGDCYERLEFLGDALVGAYVARILYERLPGAREGELSFLRSALVRREALAAWAERVGLGPLLRLGAGARRIAGKGRRSILADAMEAIVAVVTLEHGYEVGARVVAEGLVREIPEYQAARRDLEPKSVLQERLAAAGRPAPVYRLLGEGPPFRVRVSWEGGSAVGEGQSRREAESQAARRALELLDAVEVARA